MGIAEEMKSLAQEIVSSYDSRILAVATIIETTYQMREAFKTERAKMSEQLKEKLANGKTLRRKDFDAMVHGILSCQEEREEEVRRLLKSFVDEHHKMASELRGLLNHPESVKIEDLRALMGEIQKWQTERAKEVRSALEGFQREHEEMARELRMLLTKGESLKIEDLKATLKKIRTQQEEREAEVRHCEPFALVIASAAKQSCSVAQGRLREAISNEFK